MTTNSKNVIADLFPRHPIYIPLLPDDAQATIAKVHQHTEPAKKMLTDEGFEHRDLVDIFDGGPVLHCDTAKIRAVNESRSFMVSEIVESLTQTTHSSGIAVSRIFEPAWERLKWATTKPQQSIKSPRWN